MKRVLILGANGGLGQTFQNLLKGESNFEAHDRASCDVTKPDQLERVIKSYKPDVVINCSGYTAVDKAEMEKAQAMAINSDAVATITKLSQNLNFKFVHFSTDYIFDGNANRPYTETDTAKPINVYGESKLSGEVAALTNPNTLVLRTSWLYSEYGKSFPEKILTKALNGEKLKVVSDQFSSPTYAHDLATATLDLLVRDKSGLYNYSCDEKTNWHEFATETIKLFNHIKKTNLSLPEPIKTSDLTLPAARPKNTLLDLTKVRDAGVIVRPWQKALEHYLVNLIELKFD